MNPVNKSKPCIAGNTATGTLKLIALLFMLCDHIGVVFFSGKAPFTQNIYEMRVLGRIAVPIYCWCMVVGAVYTKNIWKYLLRIVAVGIVTQPIYAIALNHDWYELNIFATLALGLLGVAGLKSKNVFLKCILPAIAVLISLFLKMDYGWQGVLLIILLYTVRERRGSVTALLIAFCLMWGYTSGGTVSSFFGLKMPAKIDFLPYSEKLLKSVLHTQTLSILSLPFILIRMPDIRLPKWLSYSLYPGHLLIIYIVSCILKTSMANPDAAFADYWQSLFDHERLFMIKDGYKMRDRELLTPYLSQLLQLK